MVALLFLSVAWLCAASPRRYELLKSNQVDEASMTDLSRLVFKIIPYDKSEVIQMMYKLLYLESQLENPAA